MAASAGAGYGRQRRGDGAARFGHGRQEPLRVLGPEVIEMSRDQLHRCGDHPLGDAVVC
jgi:hypothetical protein